MFSIYPIIIFFIFFYFYNISIATLSLSIYYLIFFILLKLKKNVLNKKYFFYFILLLILSSISIIFNNEEIIKWKVSIVNWILASMFLFFYYFKKTFVHSYLKKNKIILNKKTVNYVNLSYCLFFLFLGFLNMYVIYNFSTPHWLIFKFFILPFIIILFCIIQIIILYNYIKIET